MHTRTQLYAMCSLSDEASSGLDRHNRKKSKELAIGIPDYLEL